MILIVCEECELCLRVMGDPKEISFLLGPESDLWPDKFVCPKCEKSMRGFLELEADPRVLNFVDLVDLNPQEAFAAMNGMGLPSEGQCSQETVSTLLREHPIRRIKAVDIPNTNRCRLDSLELWDGTQVYLAAGAEGAVVYRIVRPTSYVEKVDGSSGQ
jgi:hypothetical protein